MEYNVAKMRDKIRLFEKTGKEMATFFLTPGEVAEVLDLLKGYEYTLSGGYAEAERRIIVVGEKEADVSQWITAIRVQSATKELTHREVLGSVLGLGIKREMMGDILIEGKTADFLVMQEIKDFIVYNLNRIGRESVEVREISLPEVLNGESHKKYKTISVASLRVDAMISGSFDIAREKSSLLFTQEKVLVNFLPCTNQSKIVKEGDLISARGYGRAKILEIKGETKRGRIKVVMEIY